MRGKRDTMAKATEKNRITPADAGKSMPTLTKSLTYGDHPRGCGENANHMCIVCLPAGITPADAGKTAR